MAFGKVFDFQPRSECVNEPNFLFAAGKKFSAEPKSLVKKQSILHLLPTKKPSQWWKRRSPWALP